MNFLLITKVTWFRVPHAWLPWVFATGGSQPLGVRWMKRCRAGPEGQSNLWLIGDLHPPGFCLDLSSTGGSQSPTINTAEPSPAKRFFQLLIKHFLRQIRHVHGARVGARIVSSSDSRILRTKAGLPRVPELPKDSPFPPQAGDHHWNKC